MNTRTPIIQFTGALAIALLAGCTTSEYGSSATSNTVKDLAGANWDGLVRLEKSTADAVWALPGVDLSVYKKVAIVDPEISFRRDWQRDQNTTRTLDRISDRDVEKILETGRKFLVEEFQIELIQNGYQVVQSHGSDVLLVKPSIVNLDLRAPNPEGSIGAWTRTYTDGTGSATLVIELYDSVTNQLLVRAIDSKDDSGSSLNWEMPRMPRSNVLDARRAFSDWAEMLVNGLKRADAAAREK